MQAIFVRHGETEWNKLKKIQGRKDFPLNDVGIMEAEELASFLKLKGLKIDSIISSPLKRAYKTASIIKESLNIPSDIIIDESFIERNFGPREGMDVSKEVFKDILNDTAIGVEKSFEIQKRVKEGLESLYKEHKYDNVLIVAHSHTIKAITTYLEPNRYRFDDKLDNCSLTIVRVESDFMQVEQFNVSKFKKII